MNIIPSTCRERRVEGRRNLRRWIEKQDDRYIRIHNGRGSWQWQKSKVEQNEDCFWTYLSRKPSNAESQGRSKTRLYFNISIPFEKQHPLIAHGTILRKKIIKEISNSFNTIILDIRSHLIYPRDKRDLGFFVRNLSHNNDDDDNDYDDDHTNTKAPPFFAPYSPQKLLSSLNLFQSSLHGLLRSLGLSYGGVNVNFLEFHHNTEFVKHMRQLLDFSLDG